MHSDANIDISRLHAKWNALQVNANNSSKAALENALLEHLNYIKRRNLLHDFLYSENCKIILEITAQNFTKLFNFVIDNLCSGILSATNCLKDLLANNNHAILRMSLVQEENNLQRQIITLTQENGMLIEAMHVCLSDAANFNARDNNVFSFKNKKIFLTNLLNLVKEIDESNSGFLKEFLKNRSQAIAQIIENCNLEIFQILLKYKSELVEMMQKTTWKEAPIQKRNIIFAALSNKDFSLTKNVLQNFAQETKDVLTSDWYGVAHALYYCSNIDGVNYILDFAKNNLHIDKKDIIRAINFENQSDIFKRNVALLHKEVGISPKIFHQILLGQNFSQLNEILPLVDKKRLVTAYNYAQLRQLENFNENAVLCIAVLNSVDIDSLTIVQKSKYEKLSQIFHEVFRHSEDKLSEFTQSFLTVANIENLKKKSLFEVAKNEIALDFWQFYEAESKKLIAYACEFYDDAFLMSEYENDFLRYNKIQNELTRKISSYDTEILDFKNLQYSDILLKANKLVAAQLYDTQISDFKISQQNFSIDENFAKNFLTNLNQVLKQSSQEVLQKTFLQKKYQLVPVSIRSEGMSMENRKLHIANAA